MLLNAPSTSLFVALTLASAVTLSSGLAWAQSAPTATPTPQAPPSTAPATPGAESTQATQPTQPASPPAERPAEAPPSTTAAEPAAPVSTGATAPVAPAPGPSVVAPPAEAPTAEPPPDDASQDPKRGLAKNVLFIEALGSAIYYSVNYERQVGNDVGLRFGVGYVGFSDGGSDSNDLIAIPLGITYSGVRKGKNALEIHGGAAFVYESGIGVPGSSYSSSQHFIAVLHAGLGYRRHVLEGDTGFFLRAGVDVLALISDFRAVYPWPYVGVGVAF